MLLLGTCQCKRPVLLSRAIVTSGPKLLLLAMSGCVVLLKLRSVLMFIAHITTIAHVNRVLKFKGHGELTLPLASPGIETPMTPTQRVAHTDLPKAVLPLT